MAVLALTASAGAVQTAITVNPLTVGHGGNILSGSILGLPVNANVTINGQQFTTDASGTVSLGGPLLATATGLSVGFTDTNGTAQTADVPLSTSGGGGLNLSAILGLLLGQTLTTAQAQVTVGTPAAPGGTGGTTTTTTTTTPTSTTPTSTGGGGGGGGGGGSTGGGGSGTTGTGAGGTTVTGSGTTAGTAGKTTTAKTTATALAGLLELPKGLKSIPVADVKSPYRLVIQKVAFSNTTVKSRRPFALTLQVRDTRGYLVRGVPVNFKSVPGGQIAGIKTVMTAKNGTATLTISPTTKLKLISGNRLNLWLRAAKPGDPPLGGVSTRRLVSVRVSR